MAKSDEAFWKAWSFPPKGTIGSGCGRSSAEYYFNAGVAAERERCLAAVEAEPELPGDMPDEMWEVMRRADRNTLSELLRLTVRETKQEITRRIRGEEGEE